MTTFLPLYPQKVVTLCRLVHYQEVFGENYDGGKVERLPLGTDDDSSQEDRKLLCDAAITISHVNEGHFRIHSWVKKSHAAGARTATSTGC